MNCGEFQDRLQLFLDGELPIHEESSLQRHSKNCTSCAESLDAAHRLADGLRLQPLYLPPPGFTDRVVARLSAENRRHVHQKQWLALAASILVAGFALWAGNMWLGNTARQPVDIAENSPKNGVHPLLTLGARIEEAVPVTLDATRHVVQETVSTASSLVPTMERFSIPQLPVPMEVTFVPIREMTQTVAITIEPVAHSAQKTWNAMWNGTETR